MRRRRPRTGLHKRGDVHLRCLLAHGARAVLRVAVQLAERAPDRLTRLIAVANKLARIVWAVWHYERVFEPRPLAPAIA